MKIQSMLSYNTKREAIVVGENLKIIYVVFENALCAFIFLINFFPNCSSIFCVCSNRQNGSSPENAGGKKMPSRINL